MNDPPDFSRLPITLRGGPAARGRTVEIRPDRVRVTKKTAFGTLEWEEPISAFTAVLRRPSTRKYGRSREGALIQVVELVHPRPELTLRLYQADWRQCIHQTIEDTARALGLPLLDLCAGGIRIRAPGDLGKPLRALLAVEGRAPDREVPAPPAGIVLRRAEGELRIAAAPWAIPSLWVSLAVLLAGCGLAWQGARADELDLFLSGVLLAMAASGVAVDLSGRALMGLVTRPRLVITPRAIESYRRKPFGGRRRKTISLDRVKAICRIEFQLVDHLIVESNETRVFLAGFDRRQLRWLEHVLLSAVSASPGPLV